METARVRVRITRIRPGDSPGLKDFFADWDFRQEKVTGVPRHFLGQGHPIPVFGPLPKAAKDGKKEGL